MCRHATSHTQVGEEEEMKALENGDANHDQHKDDKFDNVRQFKVFKPDGRYHLT